MPATKERVREAWDEIRTGVRYAECSGISVALTYPRDDVLHRAFRVSQGVADMAKNQGILSRDMSKSELKTRGLYTDFDAKRSESLRQQIENRAQIAEQSSVADAEPIMRQVRKMSSELNVLERSLTTWMPKTAESLGDQVFFNILACYCTELRAMPGRKLWPRYQNIVDDQRLGFVSNVHLEIKDMLYGVPVDVVRAVARDPSVSIRWAICEQNGMAFFSGSTAELNLNQVHLCHWLRYYHESQKAFGSCSKDILDNDQLFDNWVQNRLQELRDQSSGGGKPGGRTKVETHIFTKKG